jgi:Zn-dependent protease/CBS domain-containing protein
VRLDWSLLIIFALVTTSVGGGLFPAWHPDWSAATVWLTAGAAAVLLIASVLAHELSHALMGRRHGVDIKRITLFVFGGLAHLEREPDDWRAELWMAAIGPVVSLAIGLACTFAATAGVDTGALTTVGAEALLAELGPMQTLLLWLGPVNIVLALFNIVPAFPLDGGRVLRAILWGATGSLERATRRAAGAGRLFSWLLIGSGIAMALGVNVPPFGTGLGAGLWIALIGWFLHNAAIASTRQVEARAALSGVSVAKLMRTNIAAVDARTSVQTLVDEHIMASDQRCFPVVADGALAGLVCLDDVRRTPRATWGAVAVADIMTPRERLAVVAPQDPAAEALATIGMRAVNQLPVVEHGRLRGLLTREDILKWLSLKGGHAARHDHA